MLTLTVTGYDQQHIDIIKYTSIICSYGHAKVEIEENKIIVSIDANPCQVNELGVCGAMEQESGLGESGKRCM